MIDKDYLKQDYDVQNWKIKLAFIRDQINHRLSDYPNFAGIDFCDVNANGIQIRGNHTT
jgi:hypothetical protein